MDEISNPFAPGAGTKPPELAGRDDVLYQARILIGRVQAGKPERSILMTGLRGVGKTVLLNEIAYMASQAGYKVIQLEVSENKTLTQLLAPRLRSLLYDLNRMAGAGHAVRRAFAVFKGFLGAVKVSVGEVEVGLDIEPEVGCADSGDIELDLPDLFTAVAEAAQERKTAIALLIDEIQYVKSEELGALIMAMHKMQQKQLPLILVAAGLPTIPKLMGDAKSYAERLFVYPHIGPLADQDARKALKDPVEANGISFTEDALKQLYEQTHGYPYFLQEWGYQAWNSAMVSPIDTDILPAATRQATDRLDKGFFRVRFDRCTPTEKKFLRAMAQLGAGPHRISDIAVCLGSRTTSLGPTRASLMSKGMVYSPSHGDLDFTVPLFDEFMLRAMPKLETNT